MEFVAILIGTDDDPQNTESQVEQLKDIGVTVFRTATEAVEYISLRFGMSKESKAAPVSLDQLKQPLAAINLDSNPFMKASRPRARKLSTWSGVRPRVGMRGSRPCWQR